MQLALDRCSFPCRKAALVISIAMCARAADARQTQLSQWSSAGDQAFRGFGWKVAGARDVDGNGRADVIVGARDTRGNNFANPGPAYVYLASSTGQLPAAASWTFPPGNPPAAEYLDAAVGYAVDSAGDVNGDGYGDVLIGAPRTTNGEYREGRVYLFLGGAHWSTSPPTLPDWSVECNQNSALFGYSIAGIGDVNGDQYDDVAVGAPGYDATYVDQGRVYVYLGSSRGLSVGPAWTYTHAVDVRDQGAQLGFDIEGAGDVNGDGYDDLIVGAREWDQDPSALLDANGAVYVFHGGASGLGAQPAREMFGTGYIDLGLKVAGAGDIDGDGFDDVLVTAKSGSQNCASGQHNCDGLVRLHRGGPSGISNSPFLALEDSATSNIEFGSGIGGVGDFNADGFDDFVIGARYQGGGVATLYLGNGTGAQLATFPLLPPGQSAAEFGQAVAGLGDVSGDGLPDIAVGAWAFDVAPPAATNHGRVDVYLGALQPFPAPGSAEAYCTAKPNSQGCTAHVAFSGAPTLGGADDFVISGTQVINHKSGLLFWGRAPAALPFLGGTKCVAAPMVRTPLVDSGGAPPPDDCSGVLAFAVTHAYMSATGMTAGDTLFAQWWTRDPASQPFHVGLTDALRFTISP